MQIAQGRTIRWLTAFALATTVRTAASLGAQRPQPPIAGTYRIVVCKRAPCTPSDTSHADRAGILVLSDSELPLAGLPDSARHLLGPSYLRGAANGCYAFAPPRRTVETYAGIARAATTHWERDSTGIVAFTLYASPDARHTVSAVVVGDTLRGTGASSGAGVAEVHYPNDTIVAVRIGPPNIAPCVEASAREWRRIQQLFKTSSP